MAHVLAGRALRPAHPPQNPLFTVVAVLTLALGIGVNAGIFTVLNGVLFRDLPAPDAHELVSIAQTVEGGQFTATTGSARSRFPIPRLSRSRADALRRAGPLRSQGDDARRRCAAGSLRRDRQLQLLHRAAATSGARARADRAGLRARRRPRRRARSRRVDDNVCRGSRRLSDAASSWIGSGSRSSASPPKGHTAARQ